MRMLSYDKFNWVLISAAIRWLINYNESAENTEWFAGAYSLQTPRISVESLTIAQRTWRFGEGTGVPSGTHFSW